MLPYLDYFLFMAKGFWQCVKLAMNVKSDFVRARLRINVLKCHTLPAQQQRQLGFDVDFSDGKIRVPVDRWDALRASVEGLVGARHGRVQKEP